MGYGGDDAEAIENISRNIMQVALMQKERNIENELKKKEFLNQISKLFEFVNKIETYLSQENPNTFLDPKAITSSIELVADASNYNKYYMGRIRHLLIWRLNSYTKNRQVISDLTFEYLDRWWVCYAEHYENVLEDERYLKYSMMGMQSQASSSFANFIQNKLAPAFHKKRKEFEQMSKRQFKNEKEAIM